MTSAIAVLQAFHEVKDGLGAGYRTDFERIVHAVDETSSDLKLALFDLPRNEFPDDPDGFGGVLITGSPESVNAPPSFLKRVERLVCDFDRQRKKVFGICFGHQVIASALGGQVGSMKVAWNLGLRSLTPCVRPDTKQVEPVLWEGSYFALHNEQVIGLPQGFKSLASTRNCQHAVMSKGTHIISTQLHPELDTEGFEAIVNNDHYVPLEQVSHDPGERSLDFGRILVRFFSG